MILNNFDVYERLPNGSLTWRTCVFGRFEVDRKLQELKEHSDNEFVAIDIQTGELWPPTASERVRRAITNAMSG